MLLISGTWHMISEKRPMQSKYFQRSALWFERSITRLVNMLRTYELFGWKSLLFYVFAIFCWTDVHANFCSCQRHILCLFPKTSPGPQCAGHISSGFTKDQKNKILKVMNEYRSKVATGREYLGSPGPQPPAADMLEVTWDDFLEKTSQRWADQCLFQHTDKSCRITVNKEYFGENLAKTWYTHESLYNENKYLDLMKSWYDEVKDFPNQLVDKYEPSITRNKIGHYAQLVNGATYLIGCGQTRYQGALYLVCHYKGGVYSTLPLYSKGDPASKCPDGCITSKYKGLCALEKYSKGSMTYYSKVLLTLLFVLQICANSYFS